VFEEKDSDKSAIRFLIAFEKAIQPAKAVDPGKRAFNFPALTAVAFMFAFVSSLHAGLWPAFLAIGGQGNDAALTQGSTQRIAVIAFIEAETFGAPPSFADFDAVDGFEDLNLIMAIGSTQRAVQGIAIGIDD
jgi:hypothetical protein